MTITYHAGVMFLQILASLQSQSGNIEFLYFLNVMQWAETANKEDKIIGLLKIEKNIKYRCYYIGGGVTRSDIRY